MSTGIDVARIFARGCTLLLPEILTTFLVVSLVKSIKYPKLNAAPFSAQ